MPFLPVAYRWILAEKLLSFFEQPQICPAMPAHSK
jgi:hypothetical protein